MTAAFMLEAHRFGQVQKVHGDASYRAMKLWPLNAANACASTIAPGLACSTRSRARLRTRARDEHGATGT